ncbi:hypothetical protein Bca4012_067464 [Brassica carinata]
MATLDMLLSAINIGGVNSPLNYVDIYAPWTFPCICKRFIRRCKQGCLQFVILKSILVAVTLVLHAKRKYKDGNFNPDQAYHYLTIIYTISYTVALYALVLFYMACRYLLQPFNPVPKFVMIKSLVFLTYCVLAGCSSFLLQNLDS